MFRRSFHTPIHPQIIKQRIGLDLRLPKQSAHQIVGHDHFLFEITISPGP
jgi:hypothetical protein